MRSMPSMPPTHARPEVAATPATTTDAHASATSGRPRSVVLALAAVLLLAAGLLLPAGGPAAAAPALPAESLNPADLAQAVVGDWVSAGDGRSASAQLPGGTGTVRVEAGARDRALGARTTQTAGSQSTPIVQITSETADRIDPTTARCLIDAAASPATPPVLGMIVECGTKTVTISFERPVADPALWLSTATIQSGVTAGNPSPAGQCTNTWMNTTVTALDGSAPVADRLSLVSSPTSVASFDGGTLTHTWQTDPTTCSHQSPNPRGYPAVRIDGVVESVTLDLEHMVQITRMPVDLASFSGATVPQADYAITVSTDVVDLQATVDAPATVAPGGAFEWAVDVKNLSTLGSHGLILRGAVPEGVTDAVVVDAPRAAS